jgi:Uncharacterized protein conserved in bacteria (DUF2213)
MGLLELAKEQLVKYSAKSPQGLYILRGISLFSGVMTYEITIDGETAIVPVLAPPEELYKHDSLDTLIGVGVYFGHDADTSNLDTAVGVVLAVDVEESYRMDVPEVNYVYSEYKEYAIPLKDTSGILGITKYASLTIGIWDESAIARIQAGEKELSTGYDAQLVAKTGIWYGTPYSYIKTNIVYDHLALLPEDNARHGNYSRIVDSKDNKDQRRYDDNSSDLIVKSRIIDSIGLAQKTEPSKLEKTNPTKEELTEMTIEELKALVESQSAAINKRLDEMIAKVETPKSATDVIVADSAKTETKSKTSEKEDIEILLKERLKEQLAVIEKAKSLGLDVDVDNFDVDAVMKEALTKNGFDIKGVTPETLAWGFSQLKPSEPNDEPKKEGSEINDSKNQKIQKQKTSINRLSDHRGNAITSDKEPASEEKKTYSSEDLAAFSAARRIAAREARNSKK